MIQKIKTFNYRPYLKQLQDVRVLGLLVFVLLVLLVSWSGIKVIQTNYELEKRMARLEQENEVLALENANQRLRNQYYETDQFLELAARRQFGRAAPGEQLVIIPEQVALKHTVDLPKLPGSAASTPDKGRSTYRRNFEAWINFFLHRSSDPTNAEL